MQADNRGNDMIDRIVEFINMYFELIAYALLVIAGLWLTNTLIEFLINKGV